MADLLVDKTAVVTGGASGNGRAIALRYAEEGADVVVADIQAEPREGGAPTHEKIEETTEQRSTYVTCDVSDADQVREAVAASDEFGSLDVMVNNAGIMIKESFLDMSEEEYDQLTDINVKGVFFGSQAAANHMKDDGGGAIINMSSAAGLQGSASYPVYSSNKGAVRLLSYSLAGTLSDHDIRVNSVHPGIIETAMTTEDIGSVGTGREEELLKGIPSDRIGTPHDVADACVYLGSDLSDYINGESLVVDGGMHHTS